jgi:hypothetical protein
VTGKYLWNIYRKTKIPTGVNIPNLLYRMKNLPNHQAVVGFDLSPNDVSLSLDLRSLRVTQPQRKMRISEGDFRIL